MNRRGFFGLLGKLVAVGAAMSVGTARCTTERNREGLLLRLGPA